MQLWHHASLFLQAWCGPEGSGGRRGCCFPRSRALTFGKGAALALRILSAVQYLRASSAGVSTECFTIVAEGAGLEKRFHANRYTPTSKQRRIVPTRARRMGFCCPDMMVLSFGKDGSRRMYSHGIILFVFSLPFS